MIPVLSAGFSSQGVSFHHDIPDFTPLSYRLHGPRAPHARKNVSNGPLGRDVGPDLLRTEAFRMRLEHRQDTLP